MSPSATATNEPSGNVASSASQSSSEIVTGSVVAMSAHPATPSGYASPRSAGRSATVTNVTPGGGSAGGSSPTVRTCCLEAQLVEVVRKPYEQRASDPASPGSRQHPRGDEAAVRVVGRRGEAYRHGLARLLREQVEAPRLALPPFAQLLDVPGDVVRDGRVRDGDVRLEVGVRRDRPNPNA